MKCKVEYHDVLQYEASSKERVLSLAKTFMEAGHKEISIEKQSNGSWIVNIKC